MPHVRKIKRKVQERSLNGLQWTAKRSMRIEQSSVRSGPSTAQYGRLFMPWIKGKCVKRHREVGCEFVSATANQL